MLVNVDVWACLSTALRRYTYLKRVATLSRKVLQCEGLAPSCERFVNVHFTTASQRTAAIFFLVELLRRYAEMYAYL